MVRDIDGLKQHMLEDRSQLLLLETVLNDIEQNVPNSVQAIYHLVELVDISILNSAEIIQRLFNLIQQPQNVEYGILCFINFIQTPKLSKRAR